MNYKICWKKFQSKYLDSRKQAFEKLSYYIFSTELKEDLGINGYFNQPKIETNPIFVDSSKNIKINGKIIKGNIGFQSKFFDDEKFDASQVKKSFEDLEKKYPNLNQIILFSNIEMGYAKKCEIEDPKHYKEIKEYLDNRKIELIDFFNWNFDKVILDNLKYRDLYYRFFCEFEEEMKYIEHRDSDVKIFFDEKYHINFYEGRSNFSNLLKENMNKKIFHLIGNRGSGKTNLIRNEFKYLRDCRILYYEINDFKNHIDKLTPTFLNYFDLEKDKYLIIDNYATYEYQESLYNTLKIFINSGWKIILLGSKEHCHILNDFKDEYFKMKLSKFSTNDIVRILKKANIEKPEQEYMESLKDVCTLNSYIEGNKLSNILNSFSKSLKNKLNNYLKKPELDIYEHFNESELETLVINNIFKENNNCHIFYNNITKKEIYKNFLETLSYKEFFEFSENAEELILIDAISEYIESPNKILPDHILNKIIKSLKVKEKIKMKIFEFKIKNNKMDYDDIDEILINCEMKNSTIESFLYFLENFDFSNEEIDFFYNYILENHYKFGDEYNFAVISLLKAFYIKFSPEQQDSIVNYLNNNIREFSDIQNEFIKSLFQNNIHLNIELKFNVRISDSNISDISYLIPFIKFKKNKDICSQLFNNIP